MIENLRCFAIATSLILVMSACGSDDPAPTSADTSSGANSDTSVAPPVAESNACSEDEPCAEGALCVDTVCVPTIATAPDATITEPPENKPTDQAPDLSCLGGTYEVGEGPATANLYGVVSRFGGGLKTFDIEVDVFLASEWDPSACEDEPESAWEDCYRSYGASIGTGLSFPVGDVEVPELCDSHSDCPLGYECMNEDLDDLCDEQFGLYVIEDLPTNTELVLRARATKFESKWHDTYVFGVVLHADQVDEDGRVHYDATMVSQAQWLLTPNTVGLDDIPDTRGVIGGRVRDCRVLGERAGWPIAEVSLALKYPAKDLVYFNNLEDDTVPLDNRDTTNIIGRFAALDVAPGWNVLAGVAQLEGETAPVGSTNVYVVPNALSIVSFPGRLPHWKQGWPDEL